MKRAIYLTVILGVVLSMAAAPDAGAGFLDKWKKKEIETRAAPRYDLYPTMSYHTGVLDQGVAASWRLGDAELLVRADCRISSDLGGAGELVAGKEAMVTGVRFGNTIIAYNVRLMKPDHMNAGAEKSSQVVPSDEDPTVGHGSGPQ